MSLHQGWVVVGLLCAVSAAAADEAPRGLLVLPDRSFQLGQYQAAAEVYDLFVQQGVHNGLLYLNQGNAHFLAGNLPEAILAYRRAERLVPNDARLRANLAEARGRVLDPPAAGTAVWPEGWPQSSRPQQVRLALVLYLAGWSLGGVWLWRGGRRWLSTGCAGLLAAVALAGWVWWNAAEDARHPLAVVAADGVVLRKGNGTSYPAWERNGLPIRLNRGVEARVHGRRPNGWLQLELADGQLGWVPASQVLIDTIGRPAAD